MRVATYNVRHGRPWRGFTSNRWLARAVARIDADVLAVQEVERSVVRSWFADQPAIIAGAAEATAHSYAPARRLAVTGSDGVALCVRGRIRDHRIVRFASGGGRQDRVALLAAIEVAGSSLSVAVTHLQNHPDEAKEQLDELLDALAPLPRPRLLLGDLNLETSDVLGRCAAAGFTLAAGAPSAPAIRAHQRIDHIAVDGLALGAVDVLHLPVSDHRAVVAEVWMR
ncbi:MAG: endonuclease/exonuclease/phosphatase family protein [Acidimicrobiales bacterium]